MPSPTAAVLEHEDLVGVDDRGHTLGDDHRRASAVTGRERGAQPRVGGEVERGERVVEQVDAGLAHEGPRDREALALAARHVRAALRDRRVEPAGHRRDEVARLRDLERLPQLVVGGVGVAVAQVAGDGAGEQVRLLGHEPDAAPQQLGLEVAHVDAVDEHRAAGRVEQPRDQVEQRRSCPAPVLPMIAVVSPAPALNEMSQSTGLLGARVVEPDVAQLERAALGAAR